MKRFYALVSIEKAENGYHIQLDGRAVKTKAGHALCAPNEDLANQLMQEWIDQKDEIVPDTMPLTQILNTQLDRVSIEREAMTAAVLKYFDTDLLCYVAAEPPELVELQKQSWQPRLDWFEQEFGCALETTTGLAALKHPQEAHDKIAQYVAALDDAHFTILQLATSLSGSIILGLAFVKGHATSDDLLGACYIEENFKATIYDAEKYGDDPMLEKDKAGKKRDFEAAESYLKSLA